METILIIDDDDGFRSVLKTMLESAGYNVLEAVNGLDGINIHRENCPDLVITDIIMPDMEGIETIMELKRLCADTKIIAMSGGGFIGANSYLDIARRSGVICTLEKPFKREQLLKAVHECIMEKTA